MRAAKASAIISVADERAETPSEVFLGGENRAVLRKIPKTGPVKLRVKNQRSIISINLSEKNAKVRNYLISTSLFPFMTLPITQDFRLNSANASITLSDEESSTTKTIPTPILKV